MNDHISRRDFFRTAAAGAIGLGLGGPLAGGVKNYADAALEDDKHSLLMKGSVNFMGFVAKEITPNDEFYITTYSDDVPSIDPRRFTLSVDGLVDRPYVLSLAELEAMKDRSEFVTLQCIGNPIGGDAISNALWDGVSLKKIIERAGPRAGLVKTAFHAGDGYTDSIPYDLSMSEEVFLAFAMNGKPLPPVHGYPLRVIVPGIYGMKNVKWLSRIELVNYDFQGYWEKRGWSDNAEIPLRSQILMPMEGKAVPMGEYTVGGVAFGGRHGVSRVQVSTDGMKTWGEASVKPPLSKWAWSLWSYKWRPSRTGKHKLTVRAFDRSGNVQESKPLLEEFLRTFPAGAKGLHSVEVRVA